MRWVSTTYRAHNPRWSFLPQCGEGAARTGGRFNPVGMPALYTSIKLQTAWLEAQQGFPFKGEPMLLCAYDPDCDDILDLTDTAGLASHGVAAADLACAWKDTATRGATPPSWALSSRLATAGIAGIIVPSFAAGAGADDINVVFWRWSSDPPHQVRVIDDDHRLPKDDRSWL